MRLLSASNRVLNSVCRLLAATCWTLMLVLGAAAQTAPSANAQTQSDAAIATWGITGSAPQRLKHLHERKDVQGSRCRARRLDFRVLSEANHAEHADRKSCKTC